MDVNEALDQALIAERAEALREWLAGLPLSEYAAEALERELAGILANDPGGYINGQRPLAGVTIDDFIADLERSNGGAVARVRNLGAEALAELRAVVLGTPEPPAPAAALAAAPLRSVQPPPPHPVVSIPLPTADDGGLAGEVSSTPDKPGFDDPAFDDSTVDGSVSLDTALAPAIPAARSAEVPDAPLLAGAATQSATPPAEDAALQQLLRLWPSLHPQARRAIVLYTSNLLLESLIAEAE
jgi:hypothetical protein